MGFDVKELEPAPVIAHVPPPAPVRLAPAFSPAPPPAPTRPAPARPTDHRPVGSSAGMRAIVNELWDRESAFFADAPDLPPPTPIEMDRSSRPRTTRYAIAIALVVAMLAGGFVIARSSATTDARALAVAADTAIATSEAPLSLSAAAEVITDLSDAALLLRDVASTDGTLGFGIADPVSDRSQYATAAAAAGDLEGAMGSLLTARLLLDALVDLPALSTRPDDAAEMGTALASAVSDARTRALRIPDGHPELEALVEDGLGRITRRAGEYAADLRSGAPVGGHLAALEAEVETLDRAIETYIASETAALDVLVEAFVNAIPSR